MTVKDLSSNGNFKIVSMPEPERAIDGVYIGDLLSWVMGRAKADCAWITIMSNLNIIAVASLSDVSCIILAEGVELDAELVNTAKEKGINVFTSALTAYEIAVFLSGALK